MKHKLGKHTTVNGPLKRTIDRLQGDPRVTKVVLGPASGKDCALPQGGIRIRRENETGFVTTAQGHSGCRDVFVYCRDEHRDGVRALIGAIG